MKREIFSLRKRILLILMGALLAVVAFMLLSVSGCAKEPEETKDAIQSVIALGKMDLDGPKVKAVAVEYDRDLTGANVSASTFELSLYDPVTYDYIGSGKVGDVTAVYVNSEAEISKSGGSGSGNYVIIEVFTDWRATFGIPYNQSLAVSLVQKSDIECGDGTVIPASDKSYNNKFGAKAKSIYFEVPEIEGFQFYTDDPGDYGADGPAYTVKNCFSQIGGTYKDVSISYALYLPEGWHAGGRYAMVTLQNPAGEDHPIATVLYTRSPAVYASEWAQNLVKETHGLDGLIVVVPVVTERVNDNGGTPAEYEAMVHFWDYIIDTYSVDENYVYGSGQSVGGMIVVETNRNRDNFFAGILLYEDQWAQNYYVDTIYAREMGNYASTAAAASMHYPRTDGYITWDYYLDSEGNKVYEDHDPYNYYYLVSDDNIMILSAADNGISTNAWTEMKYLYSDLTGTTFEKLDIDANDLYTDADLEIQNERLLHYTANNGPLNIQWISIANGLENSNGYTARKLNATYYWLLTQSRQSEVSREKLDINKPFELAEEQIVNDDRKVTVTGYDGEDVYFLTGKYGAGTQFYNSCLTSDEPIIDLYPGWLPEGMSWETGVEGAAIVSVTAIGNNAVAIEYDKNMEHIAINIIGDKVYNFLSGEYRDDTITIDPYEFYDADGNRIECTIQNVYVNDSATVVGGAARNSGSGCYVIVEFAANVSSEAVAVMQRTTVRTDRYIASASYQLRG